MKKQRWWIACRFTLSLPVIVMLWGIDSIVCYSFRQMIYSGAYNRVFYIRPVDLWVEAAALAVQRFIWLRRV